MAGIKILSIIGRHLVRRVSPGGASAS